MSAKPDYLYWDACVFSSYVGAIPERAPIIDAVIAEVGKDRNRRIITSSISIMEVAFATGHGPARPISSEHAEKIDELWRSPFVELIDTNNVLLFRARDLLRRAYAEGLTKLTPNDALHLATAVWFHHTVGAVTEINTYDGYWLKQMRTLIEIDICEPHASQPRLIA